MTETGTGWGRLTGAYLVVVSLIPALVCGFVFAAWLPSDIERYDGYAAAEPCTTAGDDCLRTVPFTVDKTVVKDAGRNTRYEATLSSPDAPARTWIVRFGDAGPLLDRLAPGDQVTAVFWRGTITAVGRDGVRQGSADEPRDDAQMTAGIGTFAGLVAALGLAFAAASLAGYGGQGPWTWRSLGKPLLIGMALTCVGVALPAFLIGLPWWVVPAVAVPFVAYAAWQLHRYRSRGVTDSSPAP
ncbi:MULTISPECIES: hypothetical protein [unclassified Streptomyces]|uniref:hypothetical protein n=1 Tax=unclassified Streptomyces TaxID=2593676 RepID=UPI00224CAB02|nr:MULTISPECIES: hypothetical protein [unclassified Streptomyces]MCX5146213.1 hypothetical protein [Streptomyces sp. NBC_00320]WSN49436.1 hypothetical protein OG299_17895 [Streptomyces sp. NBC_01296]